MEFPQATSRSPRPPSCKYSCDSYSLCSRRSMRPHPVGVSTAKDLELLGLLPGLAIPSIVGSTVYNRANRVANAGSVTASVLSSYIPHGGLREASVGSSLRGGNHAYRRQDVSYLKDKPGHGRQIKHGEWSDVVVPPSKIPQGARVIQTSVIKTGDPCYQEWYDPAERLWHRIVFPAKRPSNREQVRLLERWMTMMLARQANELNHKEDRHRKKRCTEEGSTTSSVGDDNTRKPPSPKSWDDHPTSSNSGPFVYTRGDDPRRYADGQSKTGFDGEGVREGAPGQREEKGAAVVRAQMSVLMVGFYEIIRQVTQHCEERGRLLNRIWCSLNELFEYVLREMTETVASCERRLADMSKLIDRERQEQERQDSMHRDELQMTEKMLNERWSKIVRQLREREERHRNLVTTNEETVKRLREWFPSFANYANSALASLLPTRPAEGEKTPSPQEALENDLERIQSAGLWVIFPEHGASSTASTLDSSDKNESEASLSDSTNAGGEKDEDGSSDRSPVGVRLTSAKQGRDELVLTPKVEQLPVSDVFPEPLPAAGLIHQDTTTMAQRPSKGDRGNLENREAVTCSRVEKRTRRHGGKVKAGGGARRGGHGRGRRECERKVIAGLMKHIEEVKEEADELKREVVRAKEEGLRTASTAKEGAKALIQYLERECHEMYQPAQHQECARAQGMFLSLMADPGPSVGVTFPGLLESLGMSTLTGQISTFRAARPLGVAGVHYSLVSAARALVVCRREGAASILSTSTAATIAAPAAVNLHFRSMAEFLYESELRRSDKLRAAKATLRRLIASLLFWLPLEAAGGGRSGTTVGVGAGAGASQRPAGFGKLPRDLAGHEKTALQQFQRLLRLSALHTSRRDATARDGDESEGGDDDEGNASGSKVLDPPSSVISEGSEGSVFECFTDAEECLWLRVFGALEIYARPRRTDANRQQGAPTLPDLVPLQRAVSTVEEIFGSGSLPAGRLGSRRTTTAGAVWKSRERNSSREEGSNPWLLINHVAIEDTVMTIKTAAAKHGGNHVELFDVTDAAITVGYRANREKLFQVLILMAEVADLAGELTFGTVSVVMHVASPGLSESAVRLLFYRAATSSHTEGLPCVRGERGKLGGVHKTHQGGRKIYQSKGEKAADSGVSVNGTGGVSAVRLAHAVLEFPLGCDGLEPLVVATASAKGVRELHRHLAFQTKEVVNETEQIIAAIKEAQGMDSSSPGVHVPAAETAAVKARTSQLRAFETNASTSRNTLDVSRLWFSLRMLAVESALLKAYGGVGLTTRAQDAIMQGRRVRMRRALRALKAASRGKLVSGLPSAGDGHSG